MFERIGDYKKHFGSLLKNDDKVCRLLLGNNYEDAFDDLNAELDKYIRPHLYVDGVITEVKSFIMYDINPSLISSTTNEMKIIVQLISHKQTVMYDQRPEGYLGLRYDILARYLEEIVCPRDPNKKKRSLRTLELVHLK